MRHASCILRRKRAHGDVPKREGRVRDAVERSGKQLFFGKNGYLQTFALGRHGKQNKKRKMRFRCREKGERDRQRQRKVCYPHAPPYPHARANKCHHFSPGDRLPGRYLTSPLIHNSNPAKVAARRYGASTPQIPRPLSWYIHASFSQTLPIKEVCFPLWLARSITSQHISRRSILRSPNRPVSAGIYWVLRPPLQGKMTSLYCIF